MPSAKRILLLVTQADWGGVQSFLIRFAAELRKEGHEVLLAAGGEGGLWAEAERRGIRTNRLKHVRRDIHLLEDWRAIEELKQLIRSFRPDAIHLNSSKMGVLGSIAARNFRLSTFDFRPRIVYRIGGWSFLEPLPAWKRWLYLWAERWTAQYKDVIVTVHPGDEELAKKLSIRPRERVRTVPNGLDILMFVSGLKTRAVARATLHVSDSAFVFGTVANAYPTKALLPYLDVLKHVLGKDRNTMAVIIGDGQEFDALKRKRDALGLTARVILTGQRADAPTLFPAFDIFVLPSRKEGMPWTLLEAMAAGLPTIAADVGACRWMLSDPAHGDAGVVIPSGDILALRGAMNELKNDLAQRGRFGMAARQIVTDRFSWEETYRGNRDALCGRPDGSLLPPPRPAS